MPLPAIAGAALISGGAALGSQIINYFGQKAAAKRQARYNQSLAEFQFSKNKELLQEQLKYDSPMEQMRRFSEAGLNPHLIYGKGTSGNQGSPMEFPSIQPADMSYGKDIGSALTSGLDMITKYQQARLIGSQVDLNNVKVNSETKKQTLMDAQESVLRANPLLDKDYFNATVKNIQALATLKDTEAKAASSTMTNSDWKDVFPDVRVESESLTMKQLEYLQKFQDFLSRQGLMSADRSIKNQILISKQFQNDFDKIQNDWMTDGAISGDTIRQMMLMLFRSLLR